MVQNKCLRLITGHYANINLDALHLETGISTYHTHSKQLTAIAYEKGMRMELTHPRRAALDKGISHRLKSRSSLREQGMDIVSKTQLADPSHLLSSNHSQAAPTGGYSQMNPSSTTSTQSRKPSIHLKWTMLCTLMDHTQVVHPRAVQRQWLRAVRQEICVGWTSVRQKETD